MDLTIANTFLPHLDAEESLSFYRDLLGFEVRLDVGQGRMRWITVGPPGGGTAIVLHPPAVDPGISDDERTLVTEMMAKGTYTMLTLQTHDLEATFAALEAGGAEIVSEPTDQPYGLRDCSVRDPAGTLIRINQL